ncbi:hypothetical protein M3J09_001046 [Ascochyta lentis]
MLAAEPPLLHNAVLRSSGRIICELASHISITITDYLGLFQSCRLLPCMLHHGPWRQTMTSLLLYPSHTHTFNPECCVTSASSLAVTHLQFQSSSLDAFQGRTVHT